MYCISGKRWDSIPSGMSVVSSGRQGPLISSGSLKVRDRVECGSRENHTNKIFSSRTTELVKKGIEPPKPEDIMAGIGISGTEELVALRKNSSVYYKFLRHFLSCAVGAREWKMHGESGYVTLVALDG